MNGTRYLKVSNGPRTVKEFQGGCAFFAFFGPLFNTAKEGKTLQI